MCDPAQPSLDMAKAGEHVSLDIAQTENVGVHEVYI